MIKLWIILDKILATIGNKKAQKGFFVTAISGLILQFFPDFPQESFTQLAEMLIQLFTVLGAIWTSLGIIHQWVKDNLLKQNLIPPSVEKKAEELGKPVMIDPPKKLA